MGKNTMIGVDLAKNIFQLHVATMSGAVLSKKKLSQDRFNEFMKAHELALVVLESCGIAHYWAETLGDMGHDVKLIAPQYVKPFIKRQKNDAADADAIVVAAQRPEMRFVAAKTKEQRAKGVLFRSRERLVHQRTEQVNALRAVLYEHGYVIPQGIASISRVKISLVDKTATCLSLFARNVENCRNKLPATQSLSMPRPISLNN